MCFFFASDQSWMNPWKFGTQLTKGGKCANKIIHPIHAWSNFANFLLDCYWPLGLVGRNHLCVFFLSSLKTLEEPTFFTACLEQLQESTKFLFHNHVVIGSKMWLSLWYLGVISIPACSAWLNRLMCTVNTLGGVRPVVAILGAVLSCRLNVHLLKFWNLTNVQLVVSVCPSSCLSS